MIHAIRNTATGFLFATYGNLKDRAQIDCDYMNRTELKYGRPAIYETTTTGEAVTVAPPPILPELEVEATEDDQTSPRL